MTQLGFPNRFSSFVLTHHWPRIPEAVTNILYGMRVNSNGNLGSAALAYMAEVAYAAGPALQGPRALGQNKKMCAA